MRRAFFSLLFLGLVAVAAVLVARRVPSTFLPHEDLGYAYIAMQLPKAASLQRSDVAARRVEEILKRTEGVQGYISVVGFNLLSQVQATDYNADGTVDSSSSLTQSFDGRGNLLTSVQTYDTDGDGVAEYVSTTTSTVSRATNSQDENHGPARIPARPDAPGCGRRGTREATRGLERSGVTVRGPEHRPRPAHLRGRLTRVRTAESGAVPPDATPSPREDERRRRAARHAMMTPCLSTTPT